MNIENQTTNGGEKHERLVFALGNMARVHNCPASSGSGFNRRARVVL